MNNMEKWKLVDDLIAASRGILKPEQTGMLMDLADVGNESDVAISIALDWYVEGQWTIPQRIFPAIRQWSFAWDETTDIGRSAQRALTYANHHAIV